MAGHSKWHNIRHKKAAVDAKKGKVWSKCAKAIMVAAKNGGPDPSSNLTLRYAIDEARYANMPRDTIERAIKKGAGELQGDSYEEIRYEGYGPGGVAVVVDALTDNRNRTATDVRTIFSKYGGNLGASGCVSFQFDTRGQIVIEPANVSDAESFMEQAIEAGAEDIQEPESDDDSWTVFTEPTEFASVKDALESAGVKIAEANISLIPQNTVSVTGDDVGKLFKLLDAIEDNDDVQKVYTNFEVSDADMAALNN